MQLESQALELAMELFPLLLKARPLTDPSAQRDMLRAALSFIHTAQRQKVIRSRQDPQIPQVCCAVLYCAALHCAALRYAVLCCAVLCCVLCT